MVPESRISPRQSGTSLNTVGFKQRPVGEPDGGLLGNHHPTHNGAYLRVELPDLSCDVLLRQLFRDKDRLGQVGQVQ